MPCEFVQEKCTKKWIEPMPSVAVLHYVYNEVARNEMREFVSKLRELVGAASFESAAASSYWRAIKESAHVYLNRLEEKSNQLSVDSERSHRRLINAIDSSYRALERARREGELSYANWLASASKILLERLEVRNLVDADVPTGNFASFKVNPPPRSLPGNKKGRWKDTPASSTGVFNCISCPS